MARASRKVRLPISHASGTPARWQQGDETWGELEAAYGHILMGLVRDAITVAVNTYFADEPFGRNAPYASDAVALLRAVEQFATSLGDVEMNIAGGAQSFANSILNEKLKDAGISDFSDVIRRTNDLAIAARQAIYEIDSGDCSSFHEINAWNYMVWRLHEISKTYGLPRSTNTMKVNAGDGASQFVAFIFALQKTFPTDLQRYQHSLAGLNKAVAAAIRRGKKADTLKDLKSEN